MPPDRERGPARHRPPTTNPHPAATPGEFGVNATEPRQPSLSRLVLRWTWRLDDVVNKATIVTGRWAARAVFRDMRGRGES
jgi:hypothetical protein